MTFQEMITEAYSNSKDHGFHDGEEEMSPEYLQATKIALMHSELSEALECVRDDACATTYYDKIHAIRYLIPQEGAAKPEGLLSEYADVLIRVFDEIGRLNRGEEFETVLLQKMKYNRSRPYKHGRKC